MTAVLVPPQRQVVLQGVSWATYQSLSRDLEATPGKRLTYDQGNLEIKVPLPSHESYFVSGLENSTAIPIDPYRRSLFLLRTRS